VKNELSLIKIVHDVFEEFSYVRELKELIVFGFQMVE